VCLIVTPHKKEVRQHRPGSVMLCAGCLERYKIADSMAKTAREQAQSDSTVNNLMNLFGMKP